MSCVNSSSSPPIQWAASMMVIEIAISFTAKPSVCSWICVRACRSDTMRPITVATTMGIIESFRTRISVVCA